MSKNDIAEVIKGVVANADIVAKTYGYSGHDICIRHEGRNIFSNDGVFVSNHIYFEDELKDIGSGLVRGITLNSDLSSNDGTTAAAILAKHIVLGLEPYLINKRYQRKITSMIDVRKGMEKAVKDINTCLMMQRKNLKTSDVKGLYQVAYTATRDEKLSSVLSEAFKKIGQNGRVLYKEKESEDVSVEYKTGFNLDYGYSTPLLPNVFPDPVIVIYNEKINSAEIITKVIKNTLKGGHKNLVVFAKEGAADLVIQQLIQVQQSPEVNLNINIIKLAGSEAKVEKEISDLSVITGARVLDNSSILSMTEEDFGKAKSINITDKQTTIVGGDKDEEKFKKHLDELQKSYKNNRNEADKENIRKRMANLQGQVAIINIGGLSRERIESYKSKIKDAVGSIKNAIDEGIVPGGGVALLNAYKFIVKDTNGFKQYINTDEKIGYNLVLGALRNPIQQILDNSYEKSKVKKNEIFNNNKTYVGYDAINNEVCYDLFSAGVIDPYLTILNSLKNAVDLCTLFINLDGFIVAKSEVVDNG